MHRIQPIGFSLEGREAEVQFYDVLLDGHGATFSLGGRALTTQSGMRFHSPLLGRGHLRNVALALTYAIAVGMPTPSAREVITSLTPLRRRMERYEIDGRTILDDTAGHPESLGAAFDVASMLPHRNMVAVYAVRGRRGVDVNRRNAHALADICNLHGVDPLIVTAASDRAGANDLPTADEADVTRQVLVDRGRRFVWHDTLSGALGEALNRTRRGDLIVLVGAQGMVGQVAATVDGFVAGIRRACRAVVAIDRRGGLAAEGCATSLGAGAVEPVATDGVVRRVRAAVRALVAGVGRAGDGIRAVDRNAGLASERGAASLASVAVETVLVRTTMTNGVAHA